MKFSKHTLIVILIVVFGALLRLLWLGGIPSGFFRDETALGYNAYSLWHAGKDEFGMTFPTVFRSFEVFFLPAYDYLSAPIIGLFGLTEFSTRLLSSLSGITALVIVYFTTAKLFNKTVGIVSLFVLTIVPWHIFYSRGTFEGNLALTFFAAGFLFWIYFIDTKKISHFFLSLFFFASSMYSYQAERAVVPLFGAFALAMSFPLLWKLKNKLFVPMAIVLIFMIPLISLTFQPGGYHRSAGVSIFTKDPPGYVENGFGLQNSIVYLRTRQIASLYSSYFSPRNLFIEGDYNRQRSTENFSVFYIWMLPFLLIGLGSGLKKKTTEMRLLYGWTVVAPIPAALTGDPFHTYRSLLLYFPLSIFIGLGIWEVYRWVGKRWKMRYLGYLSILGTVAISLGSLSLFLFDYAILTPANRARDWDFGYKEIVKYVESIPDAKKVVIDDPETTAYINYLFFAKADPNIYHAEVAKLGNVNDYYYSNSDKIRPEKFGRYEFRHVDWPSERGDSGTLFVMYQSRLPESEFKNDPKVSLLKEIYYPDGIIAYRIVRIK